MAKLKVFRWKARGVLGKSVWKTAHGFTAQVNGKQVRRFKDGWEKQDALDALARFTREGERPGLKSLTFGQACDRYLAVKGRKKSLKEDTRIIAHLKAELGSTTPLSEITAPRIAEYKARRLGAKSCRGGLLSAASVNRALALLRHLLRLAHEEWGVIESVPRIRLEREPQGRIRWLEPDEEARLLDACRKSRSRYLLPAVTVSLETGMRQGELLGLTWERVDFSRGVIRLEVTKSGKRREIPMRQAVYDALRGLPEPHEGRVSSTTLKTAWEEAVLRAKLTDFRGHDMRHSFASWFIMRGGTVQALRELLGHATLAMTMRYAHLAPGHLRAEMLRTEKPSADGSADSPVAELGAAASQER
jgi:integrase